MGLYRRLRLTLHGKGLGANLPASKPYVDRYPLSVVPRSVWRPNSPVVLGIQWYSAFDSPQQDSTGRWWIGRGSDLGYVRGGHAICVKPAIRTDPDEWWRFYDQGAEGACVGFSLSRMMSLFNRVKLDGRWLYKEAQKIDWWPGEDYEGTSVDAGCRVLKDYGHKLPAELAPRLGQGIEAYRWLTSVDQMFEVINMPLAKSLDAFPLLNSWGRWYPRPVWLPAETMERLFNEDGEAVTVSDK